MIIEKKVWPEFFQKIVDGDKTCEVRLANFECNSGDRLILREWDPKTKKYTGRQVKKLVTSVYKTKNFTFWTKEEIDKYGYQVISFK